MSLSSITERAPGAGLRPPSGSDGRSSLWLSWGVIYSQLFPFSDWVVALTGVDPNSHLGEAIRFFAYDTPKVLMLLTLVVFGMGVVRSFFSPEKTRALLAGKREGVGNVLAAALGIVTPVLLLFRRAAVHRLRQRRRAAWGYLFVPDLGADGQRGGAWTSVRAGRLESGADLPRASASPSPSSPAGSSAGCISSTGCEEWVRNIRSGAVELPPEELSVVDRIKAGIDAVKEIVGKVWPWIIAGIAVGAFIHGYVPADLLASIMGRDAWWSVPAAVLIGIPMYSNAAGIIPVVEALITQRGRARHRARVHDVGDRAVTAGDDHPSQGPHDQADRGVRRCGRDRHSGGRLHFQRPVPLRRRRMSARDPP